ncbi:DUF3239 domain-containing protein [Hungatella hathewayi]|uniref:DUF3239 domain-containing protein n=1 Tax=Hungatella hathewayi TaxID=154046 RepID=UPI0035635704
MKKSYMGYIHDTTSFEDWFDLKRAMKFDEEIVGNRKTKRRTIGVFLLFITGGGILFRQGFVRPSVICFVLAGLTFLLIIIQNKDNAKRYLRLVYEKGVATPAIVTKTEPLTVCALGNLDYSGENQIYGLKWFELGKIPGHQPRVGERVPCAAMFDESRERSQFRRFRIHPYCWATGRNEVLEEKAQEIGENEWDLLKLAYEKYNDLEHLEILELKPDGAPICRHYDTEEKVRLVATKAMMEDHRKKLYPNIPDLSGESDESRLYHRFTELAVQSKVYEYFCEADERDELVTIFNNPQEFAKRLRENKNPLQDREIPLFCCYGMVTNHGIWRKGKFIPWKEAVITTGKAPLREDLTVYVNGKSLARPAYQRSYYEKDVETEVLYALEEEYMKLFLNQIKNGVLE